MDEPDPPTSYSHPLRWFPEFLEFGKRRFRSQGRIMGAAILVGLVAGVGGIVFSLLSQVVSQYALEGIVGMPAAGPAGEARFEWLPQFAAEFRPWLLLIVPTVGGLLSGFLVFRFAPETEGHGTDAAIAAYHSGAGYIRPRVPLIKLIASALTIGTGGSGGREGPIAQIGAGFGSLLATFLKFSAAERRILLAAGMGAGVAAIFRAPLAGTLFAAEVLYFSPEFEPEVILPTGLASVVSYCTFGVIAHATGGTPDAWRTLFATPANFTFTSALELIPYTALALFAAVLSMIYVRTFYSSVHLFRRLPMSRYLKPALGAFLTGALGIAMYFGFGRSNAALAVLGYGYGSLQDGLSHEVALSAGLLFAIALGKIATTSLTIGSGGSGGVFGPSMVIGGCGGGALGLVFHHLWPTLVPHPGTYVILGMAGFFAAAAKTPFSTLIIVSEMTGDYRLLLPSLWVCLLAFLVSDEKPLYQSQVESRSRSLAHQGEYVRELLAGQFVDRFVKPNLDFPCLRLNDSLATVLDRFNLSSYPVLPVVNEKNLFQGVVVLDEVHRAQNSSNANTWLLTADLMRLLPRPLSADDSLDRAMELFVEYDLLALPVTDKETHGHVIGLVRRVDLAQAYLRQVHGKAE